MLDALTIMGIDRWTLRQNAVPVLPACYGFECLRDGQCVGVLFAEAVTEDPAIFELVKKIIVALKCELHGQWYETQPDYSQMDDLRFVITLGEGFEVRDDVLHLASYSPAQLLAEPALKAETWKTLQAIL